MRGSGEKNHITFFDHPLIGVEAGKTPLWWNIQLPGNAGVPQTNLRCHQCHLLQLLQQRLLLLQQRLLPQSVG